MDIKYPNKAIRVRLGMILVDLLEGDKYIGSIWLSTNRIIAVERFSGSYVSSAIHVEGMSENVITPHHRDHVAIAIADSFDNEFFMAEAEYLREPKVEHGIKEEVWPDDELPF